MFKISCIGRISNIFLKTRYENAKFCILPEAAL
jgi:hypothetical protein